MKPTIKKTKYYNLLLVNDDGPARSFRLRKGVFRFLWITLLLLAVGGGIGIYGSARFFGEYQEAVALADKREKELAEVRLQLERLANLESLLVARGDGVPLAKNEEVGAGALAVRQTAPEAELKSPDLVGVPDITGPHPTIGDTQSNAATDEEQHLIEAVKETAPAPLDSKDSQLRINGFSARIIGRERLRLSYELSTVPSNGPQTVSGTVYYKARFDNGNDVELSVYDIEGTRFAISRMKPMQNSVRLPQGYMADNISKIDVMVKLSSGNVYQDTFDLASHE